MNEALALKLLRKIMEWDEETATREYRWVRLMSLLKYDGYRDYVAGVRFAESLAGWLSQFDLAHRATAYDFVKKRLIYFSPLEIHRLVDQLYPRFIEGHRRAAQQSHQRDKGHGKVAAFAGLSGYCLETSPIPRDESVWIYLPGSRS